MNIEATLVDKILETLINNSSQHSCRESEDLAAELSDLIFDSNIVDKKENKEPLFSEDSPMLLPLDKLGEAINRVFLTLIAKENELVNTDVRAKILITIQMLDRNENKINEYHNLITCLEQIFDWIP